MSQTAQLDRLAFEFFKEFARCECCLKAVGFRENRGEKEIAKANWTDFAKAKEVQDIIESAETRELQGAVAYFVDRPPKKQTIREGKLAWNERLPDHKSKAELVIKLVGRVRNNLFHGGKFNGEWFAPQRSEKLIRYGLILLKACRNNHPAVKEAYDNCDEELLP